jgi:DNA polymerase-3 subunit delta'
MINPTFQDFLPQGEEILKLQTQIRNNRMSHALLITGEDGTGKRTLSRLIAASLLCIEKGNQPCGRCSGCIRVYDNEHPDLICIEKGNPLTADAKKSKTTIPIDDIREMIRLSNAYPFEGGNRVILISNAEDMTIQAQNCLLKILEEPPENTFFILTSNHPEQLLVTIRSRCRFLKMKPWDDERIIQILKDSGISEKKAYLAAGACNGSIGYAKRLADDENYWESRGDIVASFFGSAERSRILSVSSRWKENKTDADILFNILEEYIRIMLQHRITKKMDNRLQDISDEWKHFAVTADIKRFIFLLNRISDSRKQYGYNVNIQAIVEQLLLSFIGEVQS